MRNTRRIIFPDNFSHNSKTFSNCQPSFSAFFYDMMFLNISWPALGNRDCRVQAQINHTQVIHGPALINKWHEILTGSRYLFRTCPRAFLLLFACNFHCLKWLSPLINHVWVSWVPGFLMSADSPSHKILPQHYISNTILDFWCFHHWWYVYYKSNKLSYLREKGANSNKRKICRETVARYRE